MPKPGREVSLAAHAAAGLRSDKGNLRPSHASIKDQRHIAAAKGERVAHHRDRPIARHRNLGVDEADGRDRGILDTVPNMGWKATRREIRMKSQPEKCRLASARGAER